MTTATEHYENAGLIRQGAASNGALAVQADREVAGVLAAIQVAKQFPRNENDAVARIDRACSRPALALQAQYAYPRGGETITGPSIRLMETIAQCWGNVEFGYIILDESRSHTSGVAYAIDYESNTRVHRPFSVRHERKARGKIEPLTDPRDIYEHVANFAQRRVRACLMAIIPGDVIDMAVSKCAQTANKRTDEPLADRVRKLVLAFASLGVSREMLERKIGHPVDQFTVDDLATLRPIFTTLRDDAKDGDGSRVDEFFQRDTVKPADDTAADDTAAEGGQAERMKTAAKRAAKRKKAEQKPDDVTEQAPQSLEYKFAEQIAATDHQNVLSNIAQQIEENVEIGSLDAEQAAALFKLLDAKRV